MDAVNDTDDDVWNIFPLTDSSSFDSSLFNSCNECIDDESKAESVKTMAVRDRWRTAFRKTKLLNDPWFEFHIDEYQAENVVRHRYDATKKKWKQDKCVVKMEAKSFANGTQVMKNQVTRLTIFLR
jgi:hypothetical protein